MMHGTLIVLCAVGIVVRGSSSSCFAVDPASSGQKCVDCKQGGGSIQGGQCVIEERWMQCHDSVKECCSDDPEIQLDAEGCRNASGDSSSSSSSSSSGKDNGGEDPLPEDYCKNVVTLLSSRTNKDCQADCTALTQNNVDPRKDQTFNQNCLYQTYTVKDDHTQVDGKCFQTYIYGYSESGASGDIDRSAYKTIKNVDTPAACQQLCQEDADCVSFQYTSPLTSNGSNYDEKKSCRLKNLAQVTGAINHKFQYSASSYTTAVDPDADPEVCNAGQGYNCFTGGFTCAKCDGVRRCVWQSNSHVTGFKYCTSNDVCTIPDYDDDNNNNDNDDDEVTTTTTTTPTTTTTTTTEEPTTTTTTTTTATTTEEPTTTEQPTTTTTTTTTTTEEPTTTTSTTTTTTTPELHFESEIAQRLIWPHKIVEL